MLIFALLVGANFVMGRNPFQSFDFSAMRMNRGRQYTMRTQQKSMDATSLVMAVDKASQTVGGGGEGVVTGNLGRLVSSGVGAGLDALGITGKVKTDGNGNILGDDGNPTGLKVDAKTGKITDANGNVVGHIEGGKPDTNGNLVGGHLKLNEGKIVFLDSNGKKVDGDIKKPSDSVKDAQLALAEAQRAMTGTGLIATATAPNLLGLGGMFKELYNAVSGAKDENGKPSETIGNLNSSYATLFGGGGWSSVAGRLGGIIGENLKNMFRFTDASGSFNLGNSIKSLLNMFTTYKMLALYSRGLLETTGAGKMGRISGVSDEASVKLGHGRQMGTIFGRKMSIGEISNWIEDPNSMPLLLVWLSPAAGAIRDSINLQLTSQPPPGIMVAAKEIEVGNEKYKVVKDGDKYTVYDGNGNEVADEGKKKGIVAAIEKAGGYEKLNEAYLRVEHGTAHVIDPDGYERLCDRMEQWNEARKRMMGDLLNADNARMSNEEREAMARVSGILADEKLWKAADKNNKNGMSKEDADKFKELGNDQAAYLNWKMDAITLKLEGRANLSGHEKELLARVVGTDVEGLKRLSVSDRLTMLGITKDALAGGELQKLFKMETLKSAMQMIDRENDTLRNGASYISDKKMDADTFAALQLNENAYRYLVNKEAEQWAIRDFFAGHMEGGMFQLIARYADPMTRKAEMEQLKSQLEEQRSALNVAGEENKAQYLKKMEELENRLGLLGAISDAGISEKDMLHANGMLAIFAMQQYQQNELETGVIMEGVKNGMSPDDLQKLIGASLRGLGGKPGPGMNAAGVISESGEKQRMFSELRNEYNSFRASHNGLDYSDAMAAATRKALSIDADETKPGTRLAEKLEISQRDSEDMAERVKEAKAGKPVEFTIENTHLFSSSRDHLKETLKSLKLSVSDSDMKTIMTMKKDGEVALSIEGKNYFVELKGDTLNMYEKTGHVTAAYLIQKDKDDNVNVFNTTEQMPMKAWKERSDALFSMGAAALEKSGNETTDKNRMAVFKVAALAKGDIRVLTELKGIDVTNTEDVLKKVAEIEIAAIKKLEASVAWENSEVRQMEINRKKYSVAKDGDTYTVYDDNGAVVSDDTVKAEAKKGYRNGTLVHDAGDAYRGSYIKPEEILSTLENALNQIDKQSAYYDNKDNTHDLNYEQSYREFAEAIGSFAAKLEAGEERAREYSVGGVQREFEAARLGVWSASTYMQYAEADAFNQARQGGFYNVGNSLYAFAAIGLTSDLASPGLAKYDEKVVHQANLISHIFGGTVYAPAEGLPEYNFTAPEPVKPPAPEKKPEEKKATVVPGPVASGRLYIQSLIHGQEGKDELQRVVDYDVGVVKRMIGSNADYFKENPGSTISITQPVPIENPWAVFNKEQLGPALVDGISSKLGGADLTGIGVEAHTHYVTIDFHDVAQAHLKNGNGWTGGEYTIQAQVRHSGNKKAGVFIDLNNGNGPQSLSAVVKESKDPELASAYRDMLKANDETSIKAALEKTHERLGQDYGKYVLYLTNAPNSNVKQIYDPYRTGTIEVIPPKKK